MYERFLVQGMILIRSLVKNRDLNDAKPDPELAQVLLMLKQQFSTSEFINRCLKHLVQHYLILSPENLELWDEDPEEFVQQEDADHWEFDLRVSGSIRCGCIF